MPSAKPANMAKGRSISTKRCAGRWKARKRRQARGGRISGVTSGFTDIDQLLGGLQPSDLLILAGRPGMGKTALGTNMAFHAARAYMQDMEAGAEVPRGAPVLFFSLEMAAQQLSARILSEQTEIEMWKIRNGRFAESEWEKFVLTMQELSTLPLYIDDTGGISIAQIAARARRMKREKNIGLIIIDYLQLVEPSRRQENRVQEITEVTKGLKTLAKELNVPVLALSQLSRGVDSRDDKRPVLSDLRESGSIEQDADVVMFVYREEYYLKSREPDPSSADHAKWLEKCERAHRRAEVLVEKHRHGATNKIDLYFDDRFTRFSNLVHGHLAADPHKSGAAAGQKRDLARQQFQVIAEADQFAFHIGEVEFPQAHPPAFDVGLVAHKVLLPRHRRQQLPGLQPGEEFRIVGIEQKMIHRQVEAGDRQQQFRRAARQDIGRGAGMARTHAGQAEAPPRSVKSDSSTLWPGGP